MDPWISHRSISIFILHPTLEKSQNLSHVAYVVSSDFDCRFGRWGTGGSRTTQEIALT